MARRHEEATQLAFAPVAQFTSIYVNSHLKEGASRVSPADFIPGMKSLEPVEQPPEVLLAQFDSYNRRVGGPPLM